MILCCLYSARHRTTKLTDEEIKGVYPLFIKNARNIIETVNKLVETIEGSKNIFLSRVPVIQSIVNR